MLRKIILFVFFLSLFLLFPLKSDAACTCPDKPDYIKGSGQVVDHPGGKASGLDPNKNPKVCSYEKEIGDPGGNTKVSYWACTGTEDQCSRFEQECTSDAECQTGESICKNFRCFTKGRGYLLDTICTPKEQKGECRYAAPGVAQPAPNGCLSTQGEGCAVCGSGYYFSDGKCNLRGNSGGDPPVQPTMLPCTYGTYCIPGSGCVFPTPETASVDPNSFKPCEDPTTCEGIQTGLGFSIPTDVSGFAASILGLLLSLGGAILLIIIIITGYRLMTSQGDPEKVKAAREQLTGAIAGLLFMIFSIAILSFIGIDVLHIPGLKP